MMFLRLLFTALLSISIVLETTHAVSPCSLIALDTIAGLGTEVSVKNCGTREQGVISIHNEQKTTLYTQQIALDDHGNAVTLIPSKSTTSAGRFMVHFKETSAPFTILPDRIDSTRSSLTVTPTSLSSITDGALTVTAILRDRYDNPVSGESVALLSSRTTDQISAVSVHTDEEGRFVWRVIPGSLGTATFIPFDILRNEQLKISAEANIGTSSTSFWKTFGASLTGTEQGGENEIPQSNPTTSASSTISLVVNLPNNATEVPINELFSMNIKAVRGGSVVRSYIGTLIVESSDTDAELPKKGEDPSSPNTGRIEMRNVDQGERQVPLSFALRKTGKQTLKMYDKSDPAIQGIIEIMVKGGKNNAGEGITILDPPDGAHIKNAGSVRLQGKAPSFINIQVKGGKEIVIGESDAEGVFRIDVPLNPAYKEVTLFVTSENGAYESNPVHLIIDSEGPKVTTASINPSETKTDEKALLTVSAEPGLKSVIATVLGREYPLTLSGASTYSTLLSAPATPQIVDVTINAKDQVDNTSTILLKWTIVAKTLPHVTNIKANVEKQQISLSWDAITLLPVREYRIYIADEKDPNTILFSLGTGVPTTKATMTKIPPGKTYLLSMTAVGIDGAEGPRSNPVKAMLLGFSVTATVEKNSVRLQWNSPGNISLAEYLLEFGTESGVYTEKRTIDGKAMTTTIRDLLSGVEYEFRLTPIAVNGKVLSDLSVITRARIVEGDFIAGAADPVGFDKLPPVDPKNSYNSLHNGAPLLSEEWGDVPKTSGSGLSTTIMGILCILALIAGWLIHERRKEQRYLREMLILMEQYKGTMSQK